MTDISQITQVVNQLASMGVDLAKTMTPYAMGAAKLQALHDIIFYKSLIWGDVIFFILAIFVCCLIGVLEEFGCILVVVFFAVFIALVICSMLCFNDYVIAKYGYDHPDAYLAYQALNKITGN